MWNNRKDGDYREEAGTGQTKDSDIIMFCLRQANDIPSLTASFDLYKR